MIDLTDLQEDILTLAIEDPDRTNKEIADILDCSEDWVSEVRRKYEHKVDENEVSDELKTVSSTASDTPTAETGKSGTDRSLEILFATGAWWVPILVAVQGKEPTIVMWFLMAAGWVGVPALVFLDSKRRGSLSGGLIYTVVSLFLPMIAGLVYLSRRS